MAQLAKQLRPKVEAGVVKYDTPKPRSQKIQQFSAPTMARTARTARTVVPKQITPQQQEAQQQKITPQKIVRNKNKGCSGCRRKANQ